MTLFNKVENICAAVLLAAFFMPWAEVSFFFSISISGYNLGKVLGSYGNLVWGIPIGSILILMMNSGYNDADSLVRFIGFVTGALPIVAFLYAFADLGSTLIEYLAIGAWATLIAGTIMIFAVLFGTSENNYPL